MRKPVVEKGKSGAAYHGKNGLRQVPRLTPRKTPSTLAELNQILHKTRARRLVEAEKNCMAILGRKSL